MSEFCAYQIHRLKGLLDNRDFTTLRARSDSKRGRLEQESVQMLEWPVPAPSQNCSRVPNTRNVAWYFPQPQPPSQRAVPHPKQERIQSLIVVPQLQPQLQGQPQVQLPLQVQAEPLFQVLVPSQQLAERLPGQLVPPEQFQQLALR
jgi:hypothetical protein